MMTDAMDAVFRALASAPRRRILDVLKAHPGITVGELAAGFPMSRIAVMKHLRILEEADLVTSRKEGRTRRLHLNAVPIQFVYDRWLTEFSQFWAGRLADIKYRVERGRTDDDEHDD